MQSRTSSVLLAAAALAAVALSSAAPARAESVAKICGTEWSDAKAKNTVEPGTTWPKFLGECRTRHKADAAEATPVVPASVTPAPATTTAAAPVTPVAPPAPAPTATVATPPPVAPVPPVATATAAPAKVPSKGREAMVTRERQCGARWKQVKGTTALPTGVTTWPKYWSWCNTQIKSGQAI